MQSELVNKSIYFQCKERIVAHIVAVVAPFFFLPHDAEEVIDKFSELVTFRPIFSIRMDFKIWNFSFDIIREWLTQ